ncbi:hypothetical protein Catovirus_1_735 [Catovirus CTV1]|uniref:Uncharacterized protein n=1 Tax=Catovirus CTV1 TaxID=1977631 RepID=A0A1V0SAD7_9VIRU|nr:hypothetical protein Catovirus_1_735 [Catovirus CTV1]
MATKRYIWRVYCPATSQYETVISDTEPTVCPSDGTTPVDPSKTAIIESVFTDIITEGYINIESQLSDSGALKINASNVNGGIIMSSGIGGTNILSTNVISLTGAAASNFTTSSGNLTLKATSGLLDMDGGSGINIGNLSTTTPINIGTSSYSKNINIGNNTGSTNVTLRSGSGQLVFNSADTTSDAIQFFSSGGINSNATGIINIATSNNTGGAITLDAAFNNGGITISSGSQGIIISSNGGLIGIGTFSGGDVQIGTASIARTITIGNSTSTTSVFINSGTGGIAIGNDNSAGEIQLGNTSSAKTVVIGNNNSGTRIFQRYGTAGIIRNQEAETTLSDANSTISMADLLKNIFKITPTVDRTITLPTASAAVGGISGVQVGDSIDFTIINLSSATDEASVIISPGSGGSIVGYDTVNSYTNNVGTYFSSGSGLFRMRFTNVSNGTESYVVYRIS